LYEQPVGDRLEGRARLGRSASLPTGLLLFGGHGSTAMLEIAERLDRSSLALQLIFICGRNDKLAAALRSRKWRVPNFIEGFTSEVNRYMRLADFFIGKPGPGSLSEALAMHLPAIVECNAWTLPQERYNADWILEKQVGEVLNSFKEIEGAVSRMIEPETLRSYRGNAAGIENRAIFEIPEFFEQILERGGGSSDRQQDELIARRA
jgi:UDP-N-acetylglucosamine:LPS N-acetylglucosamine transferase